MKTRIKVSPEMLAYIGPGEMECYGWPDAVVTLSFQLARATVAVDAPAEDAAAADVVLVVAVAACQRIFGLVPDAGEWHLPTDVRLIALAIRDCALPEAPRATLRLGKSIELVCALFEKLTDDTLVPVDANGQLSASEARQIVAARRLIDENWNEKLTLEAIARACGLNRAKLTRGFRSMFDCTVADAITERRMGGARQMLLSTDLPVSSVGYACGYLNNASFTRAFSRRFGVAPTQLRAAA